MSVFQKRERPGYTGIPASNLFSDKTMFRFFLLFLDFDLHVVCNNTLVNSNSREEDEDREQRMNTTLKKDVFQTTSTNNSTPITPFYMQLRYSISPVTLPPPPPPPLSTAEHNPKSYQDISLREQ